MFEVVKGEPHFDVLDVKKCKRILAERRCGLCNGELGKVFAVIGGPLVKSNCTFSDPPMHPQCARYAIEVCPFLSKQKGYRPTREGVGLVANELVDQDARLEKIGIFFATDYYVVQVNYNRYEQDVIKVRRWIGEEWHERDKGKRGEGCPIPHSPASDGVGANGVLSESDNEADGASRAEGTPLDANSPHPPHGQ